MINIFVKNDIFKNLSQRVFKNEFNEIENLRDRKSTMVLCHVICRNRGGILTIIGRNCCLQDYLLADRLVVLHINFNAFAVLSMAITSIENHL